MRKGTAQERAKRLRKSTTDAEQRLWQSLRNRQLGRWKFRRQYPVGPFIADFACVERKLIIEVDGGQHATAPEKDHERSEDLEMRGYRVLRFWDNQVLQETDSVLEAIMFAPLEGTPSPRPSPLKGRGRGWVGNLEKSLRP